MRKRSSRGLIAIGLTMLLVGIQPATTAQAMAIGTSAIGSFSFSTKGLSFKVPSGCFLTHVIKGDGLTVTSEYAGVDCIGLAALTNTKFCNYYFKFVYTDVSKGRVYRNDYTPLRSPCKSQLAVEHARAPFTGKRGTACVEFWVNGAKRASQCHSLTTKS